MKLLLLFIGKTTESYLIEGIEQYVKRISNYITVTTAVIPSSSNKDKKRLIEEECKSVESRLKPGDMLVILDEKGKEINSRQLATTFEKWMVQSVGRVVIVVGGAYGISSSLKSKAGLVLSLSKLTFTHQMVRLILAEQIYRAMTIIRNESYHHD